MCWACKLPRTVAFSVLTARCCLLRAGCRLAAAISAAGSAWVLLFASGEQLVQEACWSNLADQRATGKDAQRTRWHSAASVTVCSPSAGCCCVVHRLPCGPVL
jgi:ABC-type uncharacterized transport system permease subunit